MRQKKLEASRSSSKGCEHKSSDLPSKKVIAKFCSAHESEVIKMRIS